MNLLKGLQQSAGIKLKEGELVEGMRSPAKLLLRLKDEYNESRLVKLGKIQDLLNKNGIQANYMQDIKTGLYGEMLKKSQKPLEINVMNPLKSLSSISEKLGNNPIVKSQMLIGVAKADPTMLNQPVGKYLGKIQALSQIYTKAAMNNGGQTLDPLLKNQVGEAVTKIAGSSQGKAVLSQLISRKAVTSLNSTLYGNSK